MRIFGQQLQDLFLPPVIRCARDGSCPEISLRQYLLGIKEGGGTGIIPYYTKILSAIAAFVAFCYIIKAGYMMFTAFGDEAKYAAAKKTLQYAIIGFVIAVLSYFIIHFFTGLLGYTGEG
ncbi:MAG: hypothetical protein Q7K33_01310 [Candidatus Berkelbacteria bacterium]|nr:hypothetical protein [Candidatus Berkelbacteria bacterium]